MTIWIQAIIFVLVAGATIRALYVVSSYGAGGENSVERPGLVIRYRQLPNISLVFLFLAVVATGFVGFKFFGWLGVIGMPVATALFGCPLAALLLIQRRSRASIYYYSNPFTQLVVLIPLFSVLAALLPRGMSGAV
jgi:hypothetical protein